MKKLPIITASTTILLGTVLVHHFTPFLYAQKTARTKVSATVPGSFLNLSGYASPYGSVVLSASGTYIRATTADQTGNFSLQDVSVQTDANEICFNTVDFQRIGDSQSCIAIDNSTKTKKDIFLPPTIGVQRTEIAYNGEGIVFGYTMPKATVDLYVSTGKVIKIAAADSGYYEYHFKHLDPGTYELYAKSHYQGKESLNPKNRVHITALSATSQLLEYLINLVKRFVQLLINTPFGILWFGIPIIIFIIILIFKIWPEKFTGIYERFIKGLERYRNRNKLHHAWFVGY